MSCCFWLQDYSDPEASAGALLGGAEFLGVFGYRPLGFHRFQPTNTQVKSSGPWAGCQLTMNGADSVVSGYRAFGVPGDGFGCW